MSVYPHLDQIKDEKTRLAVKTLFDRLATVEAQGLAPKVLAPPSTTVSGTGTQRVTNLADPVSNQDGLNLRTLRTIVSTVINSALQSIGLQPGNTVRF